MTKRPRRLPLQAEYHDRVEAIDVAFETVFISGKMKRIRRPPMIDGTTVEDFIRSNANPIFLHQEGLWEYLETDPDRGPLDHEV